MTPIACTRPAFLVNLAAAAWVLLVASGTSVPAVAAISTTGNVLPVYPGASPDPWNVGSELIVGDSATGTLQINGGSVVLSSGGTAGFDPSIVGSIVVSGAGSTWTNSKDLLLGVFGVGKLDVLQGAHVDNQDASVGHISGLGQVSVSGAGSVWTNATELVVGNGGVGSLTIEDKGRVRSADATVALNTTSAGLVTIDGEQSTWEIADSLSVGDAVNGGTAAVSLAGAGSRLYVGAAAVTQGATLSLNQTAIIVSRTGTPAQLAIYEGNSIENAGSLHIGVGTGEAGIVEVNGESSALSNQGNVFVGVNGTGTVSLFAGGTVSSSASISIGSVGLAQGVGTLIGAVSNAGIVQPGNSIGALAVDGSFSQSAVGKLRIDLGGTAAGSYDTLAVSGTAMLGGTLEADLSGLFAPLLGNTFEVVSAMGGLTGTFAAADLPALGAGKMWRINYSATAVTLAVKLAGDYNDNGVVDAADYNVWRDLLGRTFDPRADGNTDGVINLADFNLWKANFGTTAGAGALSLGQAVPEPSACICAAIAVLAFGLRQRGR